ncbi:UDP-3-O-acyl-N-acetylglucosamine deacetylase [Lignipirellula cremea]|uniref:UDP-3-O-acyl-N-acetylglucosamine deacetylase n=1 Tax=Lignipirellula cremea TaxID=2528010 RepID=A0A518DNG9_9BACT|nr:UDP-3-O-acyl-N-acetylglucosamine deacetylase [Lignipirellula cremea]QDU93387.1 UDP-3-O-[3-hydroxymyristoyl] N-acetylglucosamine deacetylase [Lignipirellula cremea]
MSDNTRTQQTIACETEASGFGYWSGQDVRIEFRPAEANTGVVFVRGDLPQPVRIGVSAAHRLEQPRRTTLTQHGVNVEMVEHILAALLALEIDNCEVWVDAAEMPGCDGSSQAFVNALDEVGILEQPATRRQIVIREPLRVTEGDAWVEAQPHAGPGLTVRYELDYGPGPIGQQTYECLVTPDNFRRELAPARTFLLEQEAVWLHSQGLGLRVGPTDLLVFNETGPIDNSLRYADECVRHKTLDVVGDMALAGCDLVGRVVAHQSGHRLNAALVTRLLAAYDQIQLGRAA